MIAARKMTAKRVSRELKTAFIRLVTESDLSSQRSSANRKTAKKIVKAKITAQRFRTNNPMVAQQSAKTTKRVDKRNFILLP